MKSLAISVFSFIAGLFAPQYTALSHKVLSFSTLTHIDPVALAFIAVWLVGVSLLLKKRKGGRA
mgnify:CR=1 FL=1